MSSKFSASPQASRTPHICRKPPDPPLYVQPPIPAQPYSGYVQFYDPYSPFEGGMVGTINMLPTDTPYTWNGVATQGFFALDLTMVNVPPSNLVEFTLDVLMGDWLADTVIVANHPIRSWSPFDSGQVTPMPQPVHGRIGWHLWS